MKIITGPVYKCNSCKKVFEVGLEDLGDPQVNSEERNMGSEIQFLWDLEFECENCNNAIEIIIEGYEYPEGFFNYGDTTSNGCLIIEKAEFKTEHDV